MKSISNQIVIYILISLCVVFTGFYFYRIQTKSQFVADRFEQNSVRACERLAYFLANPILNEDKNLISMNVGYEARDENVSSIQILGQNNQLLRGFVRIKDKARIINGNQLLTL